MNLRLKYVLVICCIGLNFVVLAQDFQGKAYYQSRTSVDMNKFGRPDMTEVQKQRMAERLKQMFQKTFVLTFNRIESIYKEEEKLVTQGENQRGRFRGMMSGAIDGVTYKNVKTKALLNKHELFGKVFLVEDKLPKLEWKITGDTKQIGGYTCFKATAIQTWEDFDFTALRGASTAGEDSETVTEEAPKPIVVEAWYTLQIPVNQGPASFWGLPGLILQINTDRTTILCSKIVLNPKDKLTLKAPSKGKIVTPEAYRTIAIKKFQEMRSTFRRRGGNQGGRR